MQLLYSNSAEIVGSQKLPLPAWLANVVPDPSWTKVNRYFGSSLHLRILATPTAPSSQAPCLWKNNFALFEYNSSSPVPRAVAVAIPFSADPDGWNKLPTPAEVALNALPLEVLKLKELNGPPPDVDAAVLKRPAVASPDAPGGNKLVPLLLVPEGKREMPANGLDTSGFTSSAFALSTSAFSCFGAGDVLAGDVAAGAHSCFSSSCTPASAFMAFALSKASLNACASGASLNFNANLSAQGSSSAWSSAHHTQHFSLPMFGDNWQ
mmetsp:Transcript_114399/g.330535  ORF Transcript_114399/g.330535 Transcript_114399/m.330535 type:complete len:266 (+) Transcript_114399:416-1213(+)